MAKAKPAPAQAAETQDDQLKPLKDRLETLAKAIDEHTQALNILRSTQDEQQEQIRTQFEEFSADIVSDISALKTGGTGRSLEDSPLEEIWRITFAETIKSVVATGTSDDVVFEMGVKRAMKNAGKAVKIAQQELKRVSEASLKSGGGDDLVNALEGA